MSDAPSPMPVPAVAPAPEHNQRQYSPDGRFWWDGNAWQPTIAAPAPLPPIPFAAPIRVTSYRTDRKGADIWFGDTSVARVADLLNQLFLSLEFRISEGMAAQAKYSKGTMGGRQTYSVAVSEHMGSIHAVVAVTMATGANRKKLVAQLAAFLNDPANLGQPAQVRDIAFALPRLSAEAQAVPTGPPRAIPPPSPTGAVPPIRVTNYRTDRKGADIWFGDTSVANVADLLNRFLLSWGLRFDGGTAGDGRYSNHAKLLARQLSYTVAVRENMGSIHVVLTRTMSSGANHKRLAAGMATFLNDPVNLRQAAVVREAAVGPPQPAAAAQAVQKGNPVGGVIAAVLVLAVGVTAFFVIGARLKNQSDNTINRNGSGPAVSSGAAPKCVPSNDNSQAGFPGYDFHKYVDATATAQCYAHWNITLGPGCHYFLDSQGPYAAPSNVWNIRFWGYGYGNTVAKLDDGHWMAFTCAINSRGEPQTTLHYPEWS